MCRWLMRYCRSWIRSNQHTRMHREGDPSLECASSSGRCNGRCQYLLDSWSTARIQYLYDPSHFHNNEQKTNWNIAMLALREGKWRGSPAPPLGHDPQGKVLGILGMGGIGRNLMKKAAAFGMTTQYHNRSQLSEEMSGGAKYVSFEELLKTSDVLSLNLPLNVRLSPPHPPIAPLFIRRQRLYEPEKHPPHNLHPRIRHDERGHRNRQHSTWSRDGRSGSRHGARERTSLVRWS